MATVGYIELLRRNSRFRRIWSAQIVSELGDWLNYAALMQLARQYGGGAEVAAVIIAIELLPFPLWSPVAGMVADRFNRRHVMMAADLLRAIIVLGFLLIDRPERLWLIYVLSALQFSLAAFFEPARQALIPSVARPEELITANQLTSITWSFTLGLGGFLGGVVADALGLTAAFLIDAASFLASFAILFGMSDTPRPQPTSAATADAGFWVAVKYLIAHPVTLAVALIKTGISIAGSGVWLLAVVYGQTVFPLGRDGALAVGILNGAHGLGALVGALVAGWFMRRQVNIAWSIFWLFTLRGVFFLLWAGAPRLWMVAAATILITICGSLLWVMSTTLLQRLTPDELRGRVFALEFGALTFAMAGFLWLIGRALDVWGWTPAFTVVATGASAFLVAGGWLALMGVSSLTKLAGDVSPGKPVGEPDAV
ncbi:MAG: MFS transporter [Chloracidobacterium sp.]|nr:MFS transporter [Chloracidobacterium sp.]MDW8216481.1 MFS transporter [Acidobacteriota bacterium]